MKITIYIYVLIPWAVCAQTKENIMVEFSVNKHYYEMNRLNDYLLDPNQNSMANLYLSVPTHRIKEGNGFNLGVTYQPLNFLDFGLYGFYQYGNMMEDLKFEAYLDPFSNETTTIYGSYEVKTSTIGFGLISTAYLNSLFHFQEMKSNILKRFILGIEFSGGIGYSRLFDIYTAHDGLYEEGNNQIDFKSRDFKGKVALKVGFNFLRTPLISNVGVKFGYQFHKTAKLKNVVGELIPNTNQTISLDFSGVFFGAYLTLGK